MSLLFLYPEIVAQLFFYALYTSLDKISIHQFVQ